MALRKSLGDGQGGARYIQNVPGRGYCFVAPVVGHGQPKTVDQPVGEDIGSSLPVLLTRLIGRDKEVSAVVDRLSLICVPPSRRMARDPTRRVAWTISAATPRQVAVRRFTMSDGETFTA
jgi:hypothetical protein